MHLRDKIRTVVSLPKTIYFNFKVLEKKDAVKLPFFVDKDVKLGKLYKNVIKLNFKSDRFSIKIGKKAIDDTPEFTKGYFSMTQNSSIVFNGNAEFSYGISFTALQQSRIVIGNNFYCNKNCVISSREAIEIGNDVLVGWNVNIRDNDGETHRIYENNRENEYKKKIVIKNHVWLCAFSSVLKGVEILEDTVVAYGTCVTKSLGEKNVILAGVPAKIVKRNIEWKR